MRETGDFVVEWSAMRISRRFGVATGALERPCERFLIPSFCTFIEKQYLECEDKYFFGCEMGNAWWKLGVSQFVIT